MELAKIELSDSDAVTVAVPALAGGVALERRLTRAAAEAVWVDLFERAVWPVEQVIVILRCITLLYIRLYCYVLYYDVKN